jgi:hypothetical protein
VEEERLVAVDGDHHVGRLSRAGHTEDIRANRTNLLYGSMGLHMVGSGGCAMHDQDQQDDRLDEYEAPCLTEFGRVEEFTRGIGVTVIIDIFP